MWEREEWALASYRQGRHLVYPDGNLNWSGFCSDCHFRNYHGLHLYEAQLMASVTCASQDVSSPLSSDEKFGFLALFLSLFFLTLQF